MRYLSRHTLYNLLKVLIEIEFQRYLFYILFEYFYIYKHVNITDIEYNYN